MCYFFRVWNRFVRHISTYSTTFISFLFNYWEEWAGGWATYLKQVSLLTVPCTVGVFSSSPFKVQHQSLLCWWSGAILWGKQCERGKREAVRWREILPRLKRMYASGDAQMAEAKVRQQKERLNVVVRREEWRETVRSWRRGGGGGGSVLHGETSLGESEWSAGIHKYTE